MKKIVTIIAIVLAIAVGDLALTYNNFIVNSDYFVKNDFEITQYKHPEKVWDKVFFGNSVVISAYMEDKSSKGYVNLGLDYGVVTDLWEMIEKKHINIGSELVIGLNYLTLYDEFETNPTYIWHKKLCRINIFRRKSIFIMAQCRIKCLKRLWKIIKTNFSIFRRRSFQRMWPHLRRLLITVMIII